jgi:Xaa-Pro aminopeptidase
VLVREPEKIDGGEREVMSFETLTLVPIDLRLIVSDMLSSSERDWLNAYHSEVRDIIGPELGPQDRAWLEQATQPVPAVNL